MSCAYLVFTPSTACSVVMVYKKRKVSSQPSPQYDYMYMAYGAKTELVKAPRMSSSQQTLASKQHFLKPPMTAVRTADDVELKEDEAQPYMYESI